MAQTATVVTVDQPLKLHSGPSLDAPAIDGMPPGSIVDVIGAEVAGFLPVAFNGETGFAALVDPNTGEQLLQVSGIAGALGGMSAGKIAGIAAAGIAAVASLWVLLRKKRK